MAVQDRSLGQRRLNSGILGASVANLSITGLRDDVVIHLRNTEPIPVSPLSKCKLQTVHKHDGRAAAVTLNRGKN